MFWELVTRLLEGITLWCIQMLTCCIPGTCKNNNNKNPQGSDETRLLPSEVRELARGNLVNDAAVSSPYTGCVFRAGRGAQQRPVPKCWKGVCARQSAAAPLLGERGSVTQRPVRTETRAGGLSCRELISAQVTVQSSRWPWQGFLTENQDQEREKYPHWRMRVYTQTPQRSRKSKSSQDRGT